MKAILVIDMPKNCSECPMFGNTHDYQYCEVTDWITDGTYKPSWCPLKPMPEKMIAEMVMGNKFAEGCVQGWNDCLEEIENG